MRKVGDEPGDRRGAGLDELRYHAARPRGGPVDDGPLRRQPHAAVNRKQEEPSEWLRLRCRDSGTPWANEYSGSRSACRWIRSGDPPRRATVSVVSPQLKPDELTVPRDDPYAEDRLARRTFGDGLSRLVDYGAGTGVVLIDATWGKARRAS